MFSKRRSESKIEPERRFKLGDLLGKGAFASVYKAIDRKDRKGCAVKKLALKTNNPACQPMTEYMIGKACNHEHVVRTLDMVQTKDFVFIQLELVNGGDLFSQLDPNGPGLDEGRSRRLSIELAQGIAFLHSKEIVHADIKPENVLVHNGKIKICDFGLAGYKGTERVGTATGTGAYMAPELVNRKSTSPYHLREAHDVWSFGICMYAMLFADLPWEKARPRDDDFALYCNKGGVSSKLYPFCTVTKPTRALMSKLLAIKASNRPAMERVVRFLQQGFPWYHGKRTPITSYGLREVKPEERLLYGTTGTTELKLTVPDMHMHQSREDLDDTASTVSDSSLPSIHDAVEDQTQLNVKYTAKTHNSKHSARDVINTQPGHVTMRKHNIRNEAVIDACVDALDRINLG